MEGFGHGSHRHDTKGGSEPHPPSGELHVSLTSARGRPDMFWESFHKKRSKLYNVIPAFLIGWRGCASSRVTCGSVPFRTQPSVMSTL